MKRRSRNAADVDLLALGRSLRLHDVVGGDEDRLLDLLSDHGIDSVDDPRIAEARRSIEEHHHRRREADRAANDRLLRRFPNLRRETVWLNGWVQTVARFDAS